jgi:hypothetical protein
VSSTIGFCLVVGISAPSGSEAWQALGVGPQRKQKE